MQGVSQRGRLGVRLDAELVREDAGAAFVRANRFATVARERVRAHEQSVPGLSEWLEPDCLARARDGEGRVAAQDPDLGQRLERADVTRLQRTAHIIDPREVLTGKECPPRDRGHHGRLAPRALYVLPADRTFREVDRARARFEIDPGVYGESQLITTGDTRDRIGADPAFDQAAPQLADDRLERGVPGGR